MPDSFFRQNFSFALRQNFSLLLLFLNPDTLTGDSLGFLLYSSDQPLVDLDKRGSPHAPVKRSQCQNSTKALRQQQLQEAIAKQCLTDSLEHLENLGFLGEQTQLFCLNLAKHLQWGCGV
ncbi:hypothetical protein [Coleofasciculus sp. FACHB-501]|uniref:hypothetical protein n=1 Tax=Cyanophyceae TaxID=3028117 RepID=UPI0016848ADE|nr:hypothetical protein [Coleofasciculus sp. FACHB-501]MBD1838886.1 hypothetical protein [Coleofasciculus sp. FACHB-501]